MIFYADGEQKQTLAEHIAGVSNFAAKFAADFGCQDWGRLAGHWHDLGKFSKRFQGYMLEGGARVEHAVVGGRYATTFDDQLRKIALQIIITCHHTGLQNSGHIQERLRKATALMEEALENIPADLLDKKLPDLPPWINSPCNQPPDIRSLEFWIRMLHSCLVDADWLDAEKRNHVMQQRPVFPVLDELRDKLDNCINEKVALAKKENWTSVNKQREIVLKACRKAALAESGFFSLTVPTGGGKTFSGMSFSLNHAVKNKLKRVIVVIPFTSIISQNAKVYAEVFGRENVIEHHSSLSPKNDTERNQLASENWDAPVIVTTNVQFFESLYANKNSKIRKLHNIAKSVIVLDEVQALPPRLLYPILDGLKELQEHYGCSIVLSTATQPALRRSKSLLPGIENLQEIIPDTVRLARDLARVHVEWNIDGITEYADIAKRIIDKKKDRVLVVTHKRKDARDIAKLLPDDTYHLSAAMCSAHRQDILDEATDKLKEKTKIVRLVSTQLIEAGVDIDFPVVFRALAGMDSLSQTAGRCNREGKEENGGLFIVFRAPTEPPAGVLRLGKGITESLINSRDIEGLAQCDDGNLDLTAPGNYQTYFRLFYAQIRKDGAGVQTYREKLDFPEVAKRFQMIEGETFPVVVPYRGAYDILDAILQKEKLSREDFRALQPFIVQVYKPELENIEQAGCIDAIHDKAFYYLIPPFERLYDKKFGLITSEDNLYPDVTVLVQ